MCVKKDWILMEIQNSSVSLAEKVAKYANAYGKSTILQTRPLHIPSFKGLNYPPTLNTDVVKLSEEAEFTSKLHKRYRTSPVNINGESYTMFESSRMGSNPAFWVKNNTTGELSYIKYTHNSEKQGHLESEILASKLYNLAGIQTPSMELCKIGDDTVGIKSNYSTGLEDFTEGKQVQDCFVADAWLANWDSLLNGNTMLKDGKAIKIDCGGALRYRAQGKLKPNFGDKVDELVTLTNGKNWVSSSIYGHMKQKDLLESFNKVTTISDDSIREVVKDEELAQTLINRKNYLKQVQNKVEQTPFTGGKLSDYFTMIDKQISTEKEAFESNFNAVMEAYEKAKGKPMPIYDSVIKTENLTNPEKAIAMYCGDDYSTAVNLFCRYGKNQEWYEWYAEQNGLTAEILPKYKEALKYALNNVSGISTHQGTTFRWQKSGTFSERFKDLKVGDTFVDASFISTSEDISNCESFRHNLNRERQTPEIIIIKGKNGKKLPKELAGFRAYENEVLYNADTEFRYLGTKDINSSDELGLTETIQYHKESHNPFADFQPCKAIYLEEV